MNSVNEILFRTYALAAFMEVPARSRLFPEPFPVRKRPSVVAAAVRASGRLTGQALLRAGAALQAGGRRLLATYQAGSKHAVEPARA